MFPLSGNSVNVTAEGTVDHTAPPKPLEGVPPVSGVPTVSGVPSGGGVLAIDPEVNMPG